MQSLKHLIAAGLIATASSAALTTPALAADEPPQRGFAHGPDYYVWQADQWRDMIMRMSPEDRTKLMAMQDKLMQMAMDQKAMNMKMDMEMEKAKRDMEFFIMRSAAPYRGSQ